jgi:hypothetical protein
MAGKEFWGNGPTTGELTENMAPSLIEGEPNDWERAFIDKDDVWRRGGIGFGTCEVTLAVKLPNHCSPRDNWFIEGDVVPSFPNWNRLLDVIIYEIKHS